MGRATRLGSAVLVALLLACGGGGGGGGGGTTGGNGGGSGSPGTRSAGWTVLVYMVADNDLEPFALSDLAEMGAVGTGGGVRIVAQVDRSPDYTNAGVLGLPDFTDTKRIVVNAGGTAQVVQEMGEQDMANPATLADFVSWGLKTYPSDHTMLVLWDHGASWIGFGVDETSGKGKLLHLNDIVQGVSQGLQGAGAQKLDVVGFDACLMATWEVAEGLKPYASYLLASEEVEPGHGWDYHALAAAKGNAAISAVDLGKAIVDGFKGQAVAEGTSKAITLSLVDLGQLAGLEAAMNALQPLASSATALARGRDAALQFGKQPDPSQSFDMVDVGDLFAEDGGAAQFAQVKSQIDAGLAQAVVYQVKGSATAAATGLAVWFPTTRSKYDKLQPTYAQFGGIGPWRTFLEGYLAGGASQAAPSFVAGSGTYQEAFGSPPSLLLAGDVTNLADVASVTIDVGLPGANDTADVYGEFPGVIGASQAVGKDVAATWDYQVLKLTQGSTSSRGYIEVAETGQGVFTATVPFGYFLAGQTSGDYAFRVLVFDQSGILQDDMYLVDASGAVGAFSPAPGSTLCPTVLHVTGATSASWSGEWVCNPNAVEFDATKDFSLAFEDIGKGTPYYAAIWVTNAAQEGDFLALSGRPRP